MEALKCTIDSNPKNIAPNLRDVYSDNEGRARRGSGFGKGGSEEDSWTDSEDSDQEMTPARFVLCWPSLFLVVDYQYFLCRSIRNAPAEPSAARFTCSSEEENTSERSRDPATPDLVMISSGSTMASSLERSLELAALHSDGLSDKERRVRQVKHNLYGHRRTSSVSIIRPLTNFSANPN